jgi:WD40 repeat protein
MRLYDVGKQSCKAVWESNLEPFSTSSLGSVNHARFSPDAIYLAVARSDDVVHVYDCRMIGRGVLHAFEHTNAPRRIPSTDSYGVVDLQWRESRARRMGLVTGGADGELSTFLKRMTRSFELPSLQGKYGSGILARHLMTPRMVLSLPKLRQKLATFR